MNQYEKIMQECQLISKKKNQDYTDGTGMYQNFERSSQLISWFENDIDRAFVALIGTKLARLAALLNEDRVPNNESIEDSFIDLTNYCALWGGKRAEDARNKTSKL